MGQPVSPGDVIAGKYRVDRVLGKGGMGIVVLATHIELRKKRALKLMLAGANASPRVADRFIREARAACLLENEHIAHVFDVGRLPSGEPFMVMEYLEGNDLADELARRGRLPLDEVVESALQACMALAEAHGRNLVHRDLKPSNLFLARQSDGSRRLKVLDFGISKRLDDSRAPATKKSAVIGSPLYMAPEQIQAPKAIDGRADIWSLGVVLYELSTGRRPFQADDFMSALARIATYRPRPPSHYAPDLPAEFDAVVLRCLEKKPERRYANVADLARDLLPFAPPGARSLGQRVERVLSISSSLPPEPPSSKMTLEMVAQDLAMADTVRAPGAEGSAPNRSPEPVEAPIEPAQPEARAEAKPPKKKSARIALLAPTLVLLGLGAGLLALFVYMPALFRSQAVSPAVPPPLGLAAPRGIESNAPPGPSDRAPQAAPAPAASGLASTASSIPLPPLSSASSAPATPAQSTAPRGR